MVTITNRSGSEPTVRNWKWTPSGMVSATPGSTSTTSSRGPRPRHTCPRPPRTYQISSTVRCRTASEVRLGGSVQWTTLPPRTAPSSRISDPSGASASAMAPARAVRKSGGSLLSICAPSSGRLRRSRALRRPPPAARIGPHAARRAPRRLCHVSGLRAQVWRAGHDRLSVLLPGAVARAAHAPLLRLVDPGRSPSGARRRRLPRRGRDRARPPELREPGGHGGAGGHPARRRRDRAGLAPALGPLDRPPPLSRGRVLDPAGRGRVLDRARRPFRRLPTARERGGARGVGPAELWGSRAPRRGRTPGAARPLRALGGRPHRGPPDRLGRDGEGDGRPHLRRLALLPQRRAAAADPDHHELAPDAGGLRDDPGVGRRVGPDRPRPRSGGRQPLRSG